MATTVMTFNIHHGRGTDGVLDLRRVARVIAGAGADVVGLQEVDRHWSARSELADQAAWLGCELGMSVAYGANLDLDPDEPGGPRRQYGTAILSGPPILDPDNAPLPRFAGQEQRGLLRARVLVRGAPLLVCNAHLQNSDPAARRAQAAAIGELIGRPAEPYVLMGDFNATPRRPEIRALTGAMVDAWAARGRGRGRTHPSRRPTRRIDYVLVAQSVTVRAAAVVTADPAASDHLPLAVALDLPTAR